MSKEKPRKPSESLPGHTPIASEYSVILGTNVERYRLAQGVNKVQFSLMTGISRPTIDKIESGECDVTLTQIEVMSKALNVSFLDLLTP